MNWTELALEISVPILSVSMLLVVWRLVKGPTAADRIIALDLLATFGIGVIAVTSIAYDHAAFLDVAIVLALVGYLATITFAHYIEKRID